MNARLLQDPAVFRDLMTRVQAGDEAAARELVECYGPHIARAVRRRLRSRRLRVLYDTSDCMQSVWAAVFDDMDRLARLEQPADLIRFLSRLAYCRLVDRHRGMHRARHDIERDVPLPGTNTAERLELYDRGQSPSRIVAAREEWNDALKEFPSEQQRILEMMRDGNSRSEMGARIGRTVRGIGYMLRRMGLLPGPGRLSQKPSVLDEDLDS